MMNKLVLVKIGGSLITDKNKPFSIKKEALKNIALEVKKAMEGDKTLIVGHGAGSFAHVPAKKYETHKGIINGESYRGIAEVADVAAQLNRIVVKQLLDVGVNAVSVSPMSMMVADNGGLKSMWTESLEKLLEHGLLPVVYGDQLMDEGNGCTIFSTEKVLGYLALHLKDKGYEVERIIHCGQTNGVYDAEGKTVPLINEEIFNGLKKVIGGSGGTDVTGGMMHKVEETLSLARQGIPGLIIDGVEHGSLAEAISGEEVLGTRVEW
jgi:isopentenyl phosphate kinase